MISPNPIITGKRAAIVLLIIAAASLPLMLLMKKSPPVGNVTQKSGNVTANGGKTATTPEETTAARDRLASVTVVVLNNDNAPPLEIKVGKKYIKIPGPSSWPKGGDNGTTGSEKGRFVASIIDTADVLKANGFKPNDAFSLIVGGTALNASNTFRVAGNHQPDIARNSSDGYTDEYHTRPNEEGIWRTLKFKNIVLSYGQVPSLTDFLVAPHTNAAAKAVPNQPNTDRTSALAYKSPEAMAADQLQAEQEIQKYREALNSADPAVRAEGIQNLALYGEQLPSDPSHPGIATYIEKALADTDTTVREAALSSLELGGGDIPMETLSRVALNDQSPELRMHALILLEERFNERSVPTLQQASHDPDPGVAQKAGELLQAYVP